MSTNVRYSIYKFLKYMKQTLCLILYGSAHEILVLLTCVCKLFLKHAGIHSYLVGLAALIVAGAFIDIPTLCM